MTTDTAAPDELELPHLKAHLWLELAELHRDQRPSRRRSRRTLAVATAAAAALAGGLVAGQLVGSPSETPLTGRIVAATDEASVSMIVHSLVEQTLPGQAEPSSVMEMWNDDTSDATRMRMRGGPQGQITDVGPLTGPTVDSPAHSGQRVVDYCNRHYTDIVDTHGASTDIMGDFGALSDDVAAGRLIEDGTEVVDGRELIRLVGQESAHTRDYVVLVDPDTYLPVRARGTSAFGETFSTTYEFLPRTAENLALLLPPIPEGFTQVDPLRDDVRVTCDAP